MPLYSEDRVRKGAEKLTKFLNAKQQGRLDGFFSVKPRSPKKDEGSSKGKGKGVGKGKADAKGAKGTKRKVSYFVSPVIMILKLTCWIPRAMTRRRVLARKRRRKSDRPEFPRLLRSVLLNALLCCNLFLTSSVIILYQ